MTYMKFLDLVKIGSEVKVNPHLSSDRLKKTTLEAISDSDKFMVKDLKITDGNGFGVIIELANGEKEWFFDNEIEVFDKDGNLIDFNDDKNKNFNISFLKEINYKKQGSTKMLFNPVNFAKWLLYSTKDII